MALDDYQFQLGTLLIGGDHVCLLKWDGLGVPEPKTQDVNLDQAPGSVLGPDWEAMRVVTLNVATIGSDGCSLTERQSDALIWAHAVAGAWQVSAVDQTLYGSLPGWGAFSILGRCRGAKIDIGQLAGGVVDLQLSFVSADSTIS